MSLLDKLAELGSRVNRLCPRINYGGCAVYASAVAKQLEAMGVPAEVVVPAPQRSWWAGSVEEARHNLRKNGVNGASVHEWERDGLLSFEHVAVRFEHAGKWYTHDSDVTREGKHIFGIDGYRATPDGLTPDEAQTLADDPDGWNSSFDRRQIPLVHELVSTVLA